MTKITGLAMLITTAAVLTTAGTASAHWHQPVSWVHRDYHDYHHDDHHHGHHGHGHGHWHGGIFSLFHRHVVVHHYYPPPPPHHHEPLYPRPTAGREERKEVVMEEEWTGKDKKHRAHLRRPSSGSGSTGTTD